jgi:hypothetical protein
MAKGLRQGDRLRLHIKRHIGCGCVNVRKLAHCLINKHYVVKMPIPVAVRSKAWVFGRSLAKIVGSNSTGGIDVCLL